jgi:hypothetical protein
MSLRDVLPLNCRANLALLTDRMEGRLSRWDRFRTWLHLRICGPCRCYHGQLDQTRRALGDLPSEEPPADLADRLWEQHEQRRS